MVLGRTDLPYALIDFDLATPGDPLDDVAYAAWLYCINSSWLQSEPRRASQEAAPLRRQLWT
jgi:aminoglycoside phosphotransferase (APT) family kinase protein